MKQRWTFLLVLIAGFWAFGAVAQDANPPAAVYNVAGVEADVTADSAAKARDQAMIEAQRTAFAQLLERLGAPASTGAKLSNDDLATLVKNIDIGEAHTSAVRYIGTFTVQFRPLAVRSFLAKRGAAFNDTQGKVTLILPVLKNGDHVVLWDEPTPWMKAWNDAARDSGLVPVIVPAGTAEDKAKISAADAVAGKIDAIRSLIEKYQTGGAVVAVLNGSTENPAAGFTLDVQHFGGGYDDGSDVAHLPLAGAADANLDRLLAQGVKQVRHKIEKEWKNDGTSSITPTPAAANGTAPLPPTWSDEAAPSRLPVAVQFATMAEWADMQRRLLATPGVRRIDVTSVGRGATEIELGFAGTPEALQLALAQHNFRMTQDVLSGRWVLKGF